MNEKNELLNDETTKEASSCCSNTSCCPPANSPFIRDTPKVGRNDPCICGNGRKYKKCCGKNV